jgi:hypothetical protein
MASLLDASKLFGGTLVVLGSALSLTLWLLPLGLPMALVGLAMCSAPGK